MEPISLCHVNKEYPNHITANKDICLDVRPGECFCLLGPNGAGKSTLVGQITTYLKPTSGTIHVCGINVVRSPEAALRRMGVMPQVCNPFLHLTVEQHFQIFSRIKRAEFAHCELFMRSFELHKHRDMKVGLLSLGQKRKLLLATALLGNPEVLVLDEPTTGLSPESRMEVWSIIQDRKKHGTTILLTTHLLDEAEALSDGIGIIQHGELIFNGRLENLRQKMGKRYEIRYKSNGDLRTRRFADMHGAVGFLEDKGISDFVLSPASLESMYFQIIGAPCSPN